MTTVVQSYLYNNILQCTTSDSPTGNVMSLFYAPNIRVYRGIGQKYRVEFRNRDNKTVSVTDSNADFVLVDKSNGKSLLTKSLRVVDGPKGIMELDITDTDILTLDAKYYSYAIKITDGESNVKIGYVDDNYGANGTLEVVDGVFPTFEASIEEDFGSGNIGSVIYLNSSVNRATTLHTAQVIFGSAFTGTLKIEGSLSQAVQGLNNDDFVTISTQYYTAQEDAVMVTWTGIYSAIRFTRSTTTGTLSKVLYRP